LPSVLIEIGVEPCLSSLEHLDHPRAEPDIDGSLGALIRGIALNLRDMRLLMRDEEELRYYSFAEEGVWWQ